MGEEKAEKLMEKIIDADSLAKEFKEHSVAEFFKKNKQMLGLYGKVRTLTTVVHEYVTNSLDACEEANILPDIEVKIDELGSEYYEITAKDNGPGLTEETVGKALGKLLAGTKFHRMMQSRGQQGIGACMKSDTLVPLADGRIFPIKEIVDRNLVGEEALSLDLNSMKLVPGKISKCWRPKNPLFIKIKTAKGRVISLTPENPVLTIQDGQPVWTRADELEKGDKIAAPNRLFAFAQKKRTMGIFDYKKTQADAPELIKEIEQKLLEKYKGLGKAGKAAGIKKDVLRNWFRRKMPNGNPHGRPSIDQLLKIGEIAGMEKQVILNRICCIGRNGTFSKIPPEIDWDTAWIAGLVAGDGHLSSEKDDKWGVNIAFTNKNKTLIEKYKKIVEEKFGLKTQQYFNEKKGYFTVQCSSKTLSRIFEFFGITRGKKCRNFDLSDDLFSLSDEIIGAYLQGLFEAEGSISKEKRMICLTLYNKKALEKIFHALLRLGVHANINKARKENRITITGKNNIYAFYQKVGFPTKNEQLIELLAGEKTNSQTDTIPSIRTMATDYVREQKRPLTILPAAAYSAIHQTNISRNSLKQLLRAVGVNGEKGAFLNALAEADISWLKVAEIEFEKNEEEFVYDLEVEGYHNFVAGGVICHNSGCTMLSQMTTGKPIRIITGSGKGKTLSLELSIDPKRNEPKISNKKELSKDFRGLAVQAKLKGVLYRDSEQGPLEYLRRSAIANPHSQISFRDPAGQKITFKRTVSKIPKSPKVVKPHPKGVTVDELISLAKYTDSRKVISFLKNDFDRMGQKSIEEIEKRVEFDLNKDPRQLTWDEAEQTVSAFRQVDFIAPSGEALRPIGEEQIRKSLQSIVEPEFLTVLTRKPQVYAGGFPFQVEVAIAYGGKAGRTVSGAEGMEKRLEIMRFANRAPLLFDAGNCAITNAVHSVDWKRYDIKDIETAPVTVLVNFISVHIPYTGAGKQAIADEDEVIEEIRLALMQSGRKAGGYIAGKRREQIRQMKREIFYKYIPEVVNALHSLAKANKTVLQKKLEKMVLDKLKLEEAKEVEELQVKNNAEAKGENGGENAKKEKGKKAKGKK